MGRLKTKFRTLLSHQTKHICKISRKLVNLHYNLLYHLAWNDPFAAKHDVDVSDILAALGWSREQEFQKFYNKPVNQDEFNVGNIFVTASDIASSS